MCIKLSLSQNIFLKTLTFSVLVPRPQLSDGGSQSHVWKLVKVEKTMFTTPFAQTVPSMPFIQKQSLLYNTYLYRSFGVQN